MGKTWGTNRVSQRLNVELGLPASASLEKARTAAAQLKARDDTVVAATRVRGELERETTPGSPYRRKTDADEVALHVRAEAILAASGKPVGSYTHVEYVEAVAQAEKDLGVTYRIVAEELPDPEEGVDLHVRAEKILAEKGKLPGDYTAEEYLLACDQAQAGGVAYETAA